MSSEKTAPETTAEKAKKEPTGSTVSVTGEFMNAKTLNHKGMKILFNRTTRTTNEHLFFIGNYPCASVPFTELPETFFEEKR